MASALEGLRASGTGGEARRVGRFRFAKSSGHRLALTGTARRRPAPIDLNYSLQPRGSFTSDCSGHRRRAKATQRWWWQSLFLSFSLSLSHTLSLSLSFQFALTWSPNQRPSTHQFTLSQFEDITSVRSSLLISSSAYIRTGLSCNTGLSGRYLVCVHWYVCALECCAPVSATRSISVVQSSGAASMYKCCRVALSVDSGGLSGLRLARFDIAMPVCMCVCVREDCEHTRRHCCGWSGTPRRSRLAKKQTYDFYWRTLHFV
ncbi:unnamed protein product [Protopolystoma xenopodis]|uniref:Uncharacterized protein n=1 Tax=Protopolystoma xenopodis TaxID=117903 RepID=A0A3S5BRG9_9PLAT|nr:unnamed protein product [Protopolystoma xenopodis]